MKARCFSLTDRCIHALLSCGVIEDTVLISVAFFAWDILPDGARHELIELVTVKYAHDTLNAMCPQSALCY